MLKQAKSLKNNYWVVVPKVQHYPFFFLSQHKRRKGGLASETSLPLDYTAHAATPDRYL